MPVTIGALREIAPQETRVSLVPEVTDKLAKEGARVLMQFDSPGISLTGQGQALETGAIGERIRVLNPTSRAVVEAEVTGPDRVRVAPNSVTQSTEVTAR